VTKGVENHLEHVKVDVDRTLLIVIALVETPIGVMLRSSHFRTSSPRA
jgi:hypothetical protein